ncbi:sugar ABC transporter substrate-binding protein [Nocardioides agariphilus]|uniref:Sugar ABC transporter substrate-binding protein n=1 Tax=Nocardioides agariphilus TaxID=433664 RepID=A0A930VKH4_9ACTN|nr:sugar ABC transporter substrate-binding protein [Nocardioides agariphilus]MBF4766207.1 sugar ABC transporter substrate-binding protein [Nocardioides agariphilus]
MDGSVGGTGSAGPSDFELERRDQVDYLVSKGMSRRGILRRMGITAVLTPPVLAALSACTGDSESDVATKLGGSAVDGKKIKMLEVSFGDVIPWCVQITDSMRFWGEMFGVELTHVDGGASPDVQIKAFEEAANRQDWDLIAVTPIQPNSLATTARQQIDAGAQVLQLAVDIGKPGEDIGYLTFIQQDYEEVGYSLASDLFTKAGGSGTCIVTQGVAGASNVTGRSKGVHRALEQFPDMELLEEAFTDYSDAESKRLWDSYVQKYPDISCAVELTAGTAALNGAVAALTAAGREKDTFVGTNNAEDFACQAVIDGKISATIRHSSNLLGMWAAVIGAQYINGTNTDVPKDSWMPSQLVSNVTQAQSMLALQQNGLNLV